MVSVVPTSPRASAGPDPCTGQRAGRSALAAVFALWAVHTAALYLWLHANLFTTGWDRPKHLVSTLIFDQTLHPVNLVTLFKVFSLNLGYYPPLFPLSAVPLYRLFGVSSTVAGMVNAGYMLILLFSVYAIGQRLYNVKVGLLSAFLISMFPFLFCMAHYTYLDYALTAWIALGAALLLATDGFRRAGYSALFGIALGLGMLTKWTPILFLAGPLALVALRGELLADGRRGLREMRLPWREGLAGILVGLGVTWLWYTPNADLASSLLLGPWLPALSVALTGAMVFFLLLPSRPSLNLAKSAAVAAWVTALWYLPRADMFRDIASIVAGGRADRPNFLTPFAYLYYPGRLVNEGLGWPLLVLVVVLTAAALRRRWMRGHLLATIWQDGYLLVWTLVPLVVATLSTHREVRSVLPVMAPVAVGFARLLWQIPAQGLRRVVIVAVIGFLVVQFFVLNLSPLAQIAQATQATAPFLDQVGLFAQGEHIQWADLGEHDPRYFITPDVLGAVAAGSGTMASRRPNLGLLINGRSFNEYNIDYVVRTQFPSLLVDNLTRNRDRLPGYVRLFGCDYLLMRDDIDGGEPSDMVQVLLKNPPAFFKDSFALVKTYSWPDGQTVYLFKNQAGRLPDQFGAEWLAPIQHATEVDFGRELRLLGYNLDESRVAVDGKLLVTLYWMSLRPMSEDYSVNLKLVNGLRHIFGEQESRPTFDAGLTSQWYPGQVVEDIRAVPVLPGTPPGAYAVEVIAQGLHGGKALMPAGGDVLLGPAQIRAGRPPAIETLNMDRALDANLDNQVRLLGYQLESGLRPGDNVHLVLFWQAMKSMSGTYDVFNHMVDATDKLQAQKDNSPVDGFYPTTEWSTGEIVRDTYDWVIPKDAPPGEYSIDTGMYSKETGQRLPVIGMAGQVIGDHVVLNHLQIKTAAR
jgi:4-amino-4-deoxy-L-arabinose transferase-like glycosyltransferase